MTDPEHIDEQPRANPPSTLVKARDLARSPYFWFVIGATVAYIAALGALAVSKYNTFNATFLDLGLENEVLWLLTHGGIGAYYSSGFASFYPLQYSRPILFLVAPFYALAPDPVTLLWMGTIALGAAAIPLYLFARVRLSSELIAATLAAVYLLFFTVAAANLFDFHYEDFFPLFLFLAAWAWVTQRRWLFALAIGLTASIDPLTVVLALAFVLYTLVAEDSDPPSVRGILRRGFETATRDWVRLGLIVGLIVLLGLYAGLGILYTAGAGAKGQDLTFGQILLFEVNSKAILLLYLLAPLVFLPLFRMRTMIVVLPYLAFVFYSVDTANWQPFGLVYPLLGTAPLLFASVEALAHPPFAPPKPAVSPPATAGRSTAPPPPAASTSVWNPRTTRAAVLRAIVAATVVLTILYFPYSPLNASVAGGYFNGNHDYGAITAQTPQTRFLAQVLGLVPSNASVLTQNNIPQLSGREHVQIAEKYVPTIPYNTIVMDSQLTYFADETAILPYAQAALENQSFGIVAEGEGALLLEQGYTGPPELYAGTNLSYQGSALLPYYASVVGSTLQGDQAGLSMWYGPYALLYPGTYQCTFVLESNRSTPSAAPAVTLDVASDGGSTVYASQTVTLGNFSAPNHPTAFVLTFSIPSITARVEFRGMNPTGASELTLERIVVAQTSYAN